MHRAYLVFTRSDNRRGYLAAAGLYRGAVAIAPCLAEWLICNLKDGRFLWLTKH